MRPVDIPNPLGGEANDALEGPASMKADQSLRNGRAQASDAESAHLRALIECTSDPIWSVDCGFRLVTFNRAYSENIQRNWGVTPQVGMCPADLTTAANVPVWLSQYQRALAEGAYRAQYSLENGQWMELSFNPIVLEGKPAGISVFGKEITKRKLHEELLKASERRFRTLVENAPCAVGISRNGATIYVNQKFAEMFGLDDAAMQVGRPIGDWWAPEWREIVLDRAARRSRGEPVPTEYEGQGLRADGSQFPLHASVAMVDLPDGPATIGFLTDMTERGNAEWALKESEARFRSYFDLPLIGMAATSVDKQFLSVNDRACQILGYTRQELVQLRWTEITHPADVDANVQQLEEMLAGKIERFSLNKRFLRKDGKAIWTALSVGCVRNADGTVKYVCSVLEDISERKAAEEAILKAEQEYRQIFELAPEGIFKTTPNGKLLSLNPAGARIFGFESTEEAVNTIEDTGRQVWLSKAERDAYAAELELKGEIQGRLYEFRRKDSTPIWLTMTARRVAGEDGQTLHYQGYFVDVTEQKRLEAQLNEHLREVRLLSEMSSALLRARTEKDLLEEYCRILVETGGYRMAWVGFAEEKPEKRVVPVAWFGHEDGYLSTVQVMWDGSKWAQGPTGRAIRSGSIEFAKDFHADPGLKAFYPHASKRGYRSMIAVPFQHSADSMACLTVYSEAQNVWSEGERRLMDHVASALGYGIRTLRTAIAKDQYERDLRISLEQTIQVIAETVDQRDPYTAGHQRRVADLCVHIARNMGLAEERVHGLRLAAGIHDLGKVGIPSEILSKPGRLTPIQYSLVKEHAQLGYEIIRGVHFPWPIADMVRQHHERLDGSGYPLGLKGDEMLLESKILAVADVVEAIATHRPYRATLGIGAALEEIAAGRGKLYDTAAVDACLRLFNDDGYVLPL